MLIQIDTLEKPINTTHLIKYLFYVEEIIKTRALKGFFTGIRIKDNKLLSKYEIDYRRLIKNLTSISVIKNKESKNNFFDADLFQIDKDRLLICLVMCIGINCFSNDEVKVIKKEGFSFLDIVDGILSSISDDSNILYFSQKKYEQKIITFVYEFLSTIVHSKQVLLAIQSNKSKSSIFKYFEDVLDGTSKYHQCCSKLDDSYQNIYTSDKELVECLVDLTKGLMFRYSIPTPIVTSSVSLSSVTPITSTTSRHTYIYNCRVYIEIFIDLLSLYLFSNKSEFEDNKDIIDHQIINYLSTIQWFGHRTFAISKKELMKFCYGHESVEGYINKCTSSILKYLNQNSPLLKKLNELIKIVNGYNPLFEFVFNPKDRLVDTINHKSEYYKFSGRQYNKLCNYRSHIRKMDEKCSPRTRLLEAMGYDSEGYDISSTIWTITKAFYTCNPDISFDFKQELVKKEFCDKDGSVIKERKLYKPLSQIMFFCSNSHHAYLAYNSPEVRRAFEEKFGSADHWLELNEDTFKEIYNYSKFLVGKTKRVRDSIFIYESILELSVIKKCFEEKIEVLNVYDCFFLKDKAKYSRLKEIIIEELEELINLYLLTSYIPQEPQT